MSTRAQCLIKDIGIYLYQHCNGDTLMYKVVSAVNGNIGRERHDDPEYLARIIFCGMVRGEEKEETGYGIGKFMHKDIEFLVVVDCKNRIISEYLVKSKQKKTLIRSVNFID